MNRVSLFEANTNARAGKVDICVHALVVGVLFSTVSPPSKEEEGDDGDEGEKGETIPRKLGKAIYDGYPDKEDYDGPDGDVSTPRIKHVFASNAMNSPAVISSNVRALFMRNSPN